MKKLMKFLEQSCMYLALNRPARQDHPRPIVALTKLDVSYIVALPLVFHTTEEWLNSTLGLHPIQVALQVTLAKLDGDMEPIVFSGEDPTTGKSHALHKRVEQLCTRAIKSSVKKKIKLHNRISVLDLI